MLYAGYCLLCIAVIVFTSEIAGLGRCDDPYFVGTIYLDGDVFIVIFSLRF